MALNISGAAFAATNFNYLIAGGGTAGLALAVRLSENASVTVGVIEAGLDHTTDLKVLAPGLFSSQLGDPTYDWNFTSIPQVELNNRSIPQNRGKQLGGSSAINGLQYTKATATDMDDWSFLGNYGWNSNKFEGYFRKFESFEAPSSRVATDLEIDYIDPAAHGHSGPINATFPSYWYPTQQAFTPTYKNLGLGVNGDPYGDDVQGAYTNAMYIDDTNQRSYAANKYFVPVRSRSNLKVLTGALVHNVTFDNTTIGGERAVATGLYFQSEGQIYHASASQEVVLSAGVFGTPQILELSGIGSRKALEALDIPVIIDNPNVGENLQDQIVLPLNFQTVPGESIFALAPNDQTISELSKSFIANASGPLAAGIISNAFLSYAQILNDSDLGRAKALGGQYVNLTINETTSGIEAQYIVLVKKLLDVNDTTAQVILFPGNNFKSTKTPNATYITISAVNAHPFSRGSSHINSADPSSPPTIDPGYLTHPNDVEILSDIVRHILKVAQTAPLSSHLANNGTLIEDGLSFNSSEAIREYVKSRALTSWHPAGTCAMQLKSWGGVVSDRLIVYGTKNLRVVDLSIAPILPRGNPTSIVYALAEKAADMIKIGANTTIPGFNN